MITDTIPSPTEDVLGRLAEATAEDSRCLALQERSREIIDQQFRALGFIGGEGVNIEGNVIHAQP